VASDLPSRAALSVSNCQTVSVGIDRDATWMVNVESSTAHKVRA